MSKMLLPNFGGSYMVWAACMLFFQAMLLIGYFYVHAAQQRFGIFTYAKWHLLLILLPILVLSFKFDKILIHQHPFLVIAIFYSLLINVGLPFLALSTSSPILQSWLYETQNPYILYSTSNLGAISALLSYPLIFEPLFNLKIQWYLWWSGYFILFILYIICIPKNNYAKYKKDIKEVGGNISIQNILSWFTLSMAGCFSLLAITNMLTFDIAVIPLLWVLPLTVYLMTFILTFKRKIWYPGWTETLFSWTIAIGVLLYLLNLLHNTLPVIVLLALQLGALFIVCINCHGRLSYIKPSDNRNLTTFYLTIAGGGFAGSLLVSTILPLVTKSFLEYPASFLLASFAISVSHHSLRMFRLTLKPVSIIYILAIILVLTVIPWILAEVSVKVMFMIITFPLFLFILYAAKRPWVMVLILFVIIVASGWTEKLFFDTSMVKKLRNFYGIYNIYESNSKRYLRHGTTIHGSQYLNGPKVQIPLSYYHPTTPAGEIFSQDTFKFSDIGMIGLGTGALATYFGAGQKLTIFELDTDNLKIAKNFFTYIDISRRNGADVKFITGDGRVSLGKINSNSYDLFIIDAFNSGSIPVHLLTLEAIKEYFRVLKPDGLVLLHISNRAFDLSPIIYSAAQRLSLYASQKDNSGYIDRDADSTVWMALCRDKKKFQILQDYKWESDQHEKMNRRPWTDEYTNFFSVMRW